LGDGAERVTAGIVARSPVEGRLVGFRDVFVRRWLRTTPGRLRVWSTALLIGLLVVGVVMGTAAHVRGDAARSVVSGAGPELVAAEGLYSALSDADATASIIFLAAGREAPELRRRYERDIRNAGRELATVSGRSGASSDEMGAIRTISRQLPIYTGYVETARTNSRLGFPVGAAYLRQASGLMRDELLPAATTVYSHAATRLDDAYRSGTSKRELVLVLGAGLGVIALLVVAQLFVFRRSNRIVNVGLLSATLLLAGLVAGTTMRFASAQSSLVDAQRKGSDAVQLLSAARILTLQAQADENTTLIERGGGQAYVREFDGVMKRLGGNDGRGGLLGDARDVAARTASQAKIDAIAKDYVQLQRLHENIRKLDDTGSYEAAVGSATTDEAAVVTRMDQAIDSAIATAKVRLDARAADARGGFGVLGLAIPLIVLLAGVAVFLGLQRRIAEYR
jgi:hypothetical protein